MHPTAILFLGLASCPLKDCCSVFKMHVKKMCHLVPLYLRDRTRIFLIAFLLLCIYYVTRPGLLLWANYWDVKDFYSFILFMKNHMSAPENTGTVCYLKGLEISQRHIVFIWSSLRKRLDYFLQLYTEIKASGWNLIKNNREQVTVYSKPNHWQGWKETAQDTQPVHRASTPPCFRGTFLHLIWPLNLTSDQGCREFAETQL